MVAATGAAVSGPRILVAGAGPTGLALALQAHSVGAAVRVIDRRPDAFRPSRALMLQSRSLEVLRPLGVVAALLARADTAPGLQLRLRRRSTRLELSDFALDDTAYPHLSLIRQADVESVLAAELATRGVAVERGVELHSIAGEPGGELRVGLRGSGQTGTTVDYVVGCDGADSTVRSLAALGGRCRGYRREVVLADVELGDHLAGGVAHVTADRGGLVFLFPLGERATWRLLATQAASGAPVGCPVSQPQLQRMLDDAHLPAQIKQVAWSSIVPLRHHLARRYRHGRVFLAGDAAHTHSPAGGQGMNTGIQDAINLGWKLANACGSADPEKLLDSYEQERRPVARTTMALTDLAFWAESGLDPVAMLGRAVLVPLAAPLLPAVLGWRRLTAAGFRTLAQLRIGYPHSPLSVDDGPRSPALAEAGKRLPDTSVTLATGEIRLHEVIASPGVHLLLDRDAPNPKRLSGHHYVYTHRLLDRPGRGLLAVRPDGYVGLRTSDATSPGVARWLSLIGAISPETHPRRSQAD